MGRVNAGRLRNGVELTDTPAHVGNGRAMRWGTAELVSLVDRVTAQVQQDVPGTPPLQIGDLSRRRGGPARPHSSHRSGRDVDVGFYYVDASGAPRAVDRFIRVTGGGRCAGLDDCRFDARRTWRLMAALVSGDTTVQYMLIAPHIRQLLLAEAQRVGADAQTVERFRLVTAPIRGSREHVTHVHVRVYCALDDRPRCHDEGPLHAWYEFSPDADEAFVAQARQRAGNRLAQERAAEVRDRARRARLMERRLAAAQRVADARRARAERRARARARVAAAQAEAQATRAERRERARERRAAALARAEASRQRRRDARSQRRGVARARVTTAARRPRRAPGADQPSLSRAERRARHRARLEAEEAERQRAVEAYRAHVEARRREAAEARAERRARYADHAAAQRDDG